MLGLPHIGPATGPREVFRGAQLMPVQGARDCVPPTIPEQVLPDAEFDVPYSYQVQAEGSPPLEFAITAGALPAGLTMDIDGLISGTTVDIGEFTFTVTVTNPCGAASADFVLEVVSEEIDRLVGLASMILDFPRGQTVAFTTAAGAVPCTDGQFAQSILCEKFPTAGRLSLAADQHQWLDNPGANIHGAGVFHSPSGNLSGLVGPANNAFQYLSQTLWWFCWDARVSGTSADITTPIFGWNPQIFRCWATYQPSTSTLRLVTNNGVSSTNRDYVIPAGRVRLAAYYDGTDLHVWVNSGARIDYLGTGALGSLGGSGGGLNFHRNLPNKVVSTSALWCGLTDGGNVAQMLADIQAWITWKA